MPTVTDRLCEKLAALTAERDKLREQRDDLLAACKAALPTLRQWENDGSLATAMVEAAIAKAEAGE